MHVDARYRTIRCAITFLPPPFSYLAIASYEFVGYCGENMRLLVSLALVGLLAASTSSFMAFEDLNFRGLFRKTVRTTDSKQEYALNGL